MFVVVKVGLPTEFCRPHDNQYIRLEGLTTDRVYLDVAISMIRSPQVLEESHVRLFRRGAACIRSSPAMHGPASSI